MAGEYNQILSLASEISIICLSFDRQHTRSGTWQQSEVKKDNVSKKGTGSTPQKGKKRKGEMKGREG